MTEDPIYFDRLQKKLSKIDNGSTTDEEFIPMDPKVGADLIRDEFPTLNEDAVQMAFILGSLADVTMGEEFVLKKDSEKSMRSSYEHYKIWRSLKGE
jgi:hypothetical protein